MVSRYYLPIRHCDDEGWFVLIIVCFPSGLNSMRLIDMTEIDTRSSWFLWKANSTPQVRVLLMLNYLWHRVLPQEAIINLNATRTTGDVPDEGIALK